MQLEDWFIWRVFWWICNPYASGLELGIPHSSRNGYHKNGTIALRWGDDICPNQEIPEGRRQMRSNRYRRTGPPGSSIRKQIR